jgi:hypothetical protein
VSRPPGRKENFFFFFFGVGGEVGQRKLLSPFIFDRPCDAAARPMKNSPRRRPQYIQYKCLRRSSPSCPSLSPSPPAGAGGGNATHPLQSAFRPAIGITLFTRADPPPSRSVIVGSEEKSRPGQRDGLYIQGEKNMGIMKYIDSGWRAEPKVNKLEPPEWLAESHSEQRPLSRLAR